MKHLLLLGAGKSATVLIEYLKNLSVQKQWKVTVADNDLSLAQSKVGEHAFTTAVQLNIQDEFARQQLIEQADLVISMMPPALHYLVAVDCISYNKHLLTASYIDTAIQQLSETIQEQKLLFLCEMGLDPGIDHMSAMQLIHHIQKEGANITSFKSHCGGLVAPESDDNPWHYKISWNPRNIVLAGKAGATYKQEHSIVQQTYASLFQNNRVVQVNDNLSFACYPNRDSLNYMPLYGLQQAATFIRTTLRHPLFCAGWNNIIQLQLTHEEKIAVTNGCTVADFFQQHVQHHRLEQVFEQMNRNPVFAEQLQFLGLLEHTKLNPGHYSAADVLQMLLETKLLLQPQDKDMIVMLHELEYTTANQKQYYLKSYLQVKGNNSMQTAMAKTVGLPLGIAAKLILENVIQTTGLHIPVLPEIYEPVLKELAQHEIAFTETLTELQ